MGELAEQWASERRPNLWGAVPQVVEMQSKGGAAGALHGALSAGARHDVHRLAGPASDDREHVPDRRRADATVIHVAARALATQALSIFGDHSDVMAARATGFAMLTSGPVQEAMDLAAVADVATLAARVPFLHFFDGFRTSYEITQIEPLEPADLRALLRSPLAPRRSSGSCLPTCCPRVN